MVYRVSFSATYAKFSSEIPADAPPCPWQFVETALSTVAPIPSTTSLPCPAFPDSRHGLHCRMRRSLSRSHATRGHAALRLRATLYSETRSAGTTCSGGRSTITLSIALTRRWGTFPFVARATSRYSQFGGRGSVRGTEMRRVAAVECQIMAVRPPSTPCMP